MPGAYPRTSTIALTTATLPYATALAERGLDALRDDPGFARGVNVRDGAITCRPVAEALDKWKFYVMFPEQTLRNNAYRCWNWFQANDSTRGRGESQSVDVIESVF